MTTQLRPIDFNGHIPDDPAPIAQLADPGDEPTKADLLVRINELEDIITAIALVSDQSAIQLAEISQRSAA
jgi:hypothetical protein